MAATLYPLLEEIAGAFGAALSALRRHDPEAGEAPPILLQVRAGYAESPGWMLIQASEFAPEPLTITRFRRRDVYGAPRLIQALFDLLLTEQWLAEAGPDAYALAEAGRAVLAQAQARRARLLAQLTPYLTVDVARLTTLLRRVIDASLQNPSFPSAWCVAHSRKRAPADDAPPIAQLLHFGDDFNALRDDTHMAAWQPFAIDGAAWEAFAYIHGGQATTATDLMPYLARRGYTQREYAAFLDQLAARGWLRADGERYAVTEAGRQARAQAEERTEAYFAIPWAVLSAEEYSEVAALLVQLRDGLLAVERRVVE